MMKIHMLIPNQTININIVAMLAQDVIIAAIFSLLSLICLLRRKPPSGATQNTITKNTVIKIVGISLRWQMGKNNDDAEKE